MTGRFHSWRAAVRIARRDAWRNKGRSLLVLLMIALPILAVSALDITVRSSRLSTAEELDRSLGTADARYEATGQGGLPVLQTPDGESYGVERKYEQDPRAAEEKYVDVPPLLPEGARWITQADSYASFRSEHGLLEAEVRELDAADPLAAGIFTLREGEFPSRAGEIAASAKFLEESGLGIGDRTTVRDTHGEFTIVGEIELPDQLGDSVVLAHQGSMLQALAEARKEAGEDYATVRLGYLVAVDGPVTWDMVREANRHSLVVTSRHVVLDPPPEAEVPYYAAYNGPGGDSGADPEVLIVAATVVGLAVLEICLLAGPAFAVGARRSRRQLGLIGANGGDRRHIRAVVLSGGLVIGTAGAVLGLLLGLGLTAVLRPTLEEAVGKRFGGLEIHPLDLLGIALVGLVTGLLAAVFPAFAAARESVLESLTGRRGVRRASRVLPALGVTAVLLGVAIALFGTVVTDSVLAVGAGSAVAELGIVALTPALVGAFGRLGRWLPLSPRLALRDAVRNRGRTAPAVAAVLAAVAGTVAVVTYTASSDREARDEYRAALPDHTLSVFVDKQDAGQLGRIRGVVQDSLPVAERADVSRVVADGKDCGPYATQQHGCGMYEVVVPKANECELWSDDGDTGALSEERRRELVDDWRCASGYMASDGHFMAYGRQLVGGPEVLDALGVRDRGARRALERGEAVVFHRPYVEDGKVRFRLIDSYDEKIEETEKQKHRTVAFPAHLAKGHAYGLEVLVPPAAAEAAGVGTTPYGSLYTTSRAPSSAERQALDGEVAKLNVAAEPYLERGHQGGDDLIALALTIFAGLVTIGAAAIATGLAQADAEADLNTLTAVGAPPRVRRTLSGFQCWVVAGMGVVLGTAAGLVPAIGLRKAEERYEQADAEEAARMGWEQMRDVHVPVVIPWTTLLELLVVVPLGAALLAALFTRSRTALARRAAQ
ncbi:hypothetical protein GCM10027168_00170 [Streptomyces capparidis]